MSSAAAPTTNTTDGGPAAAGAVAASVAPVDPDRIWFYMDGSNQQRGPLTPLDLSDLLSDREINSRTYGWRSGLSEWAVLSTLPELKGIFATAFDAADEARPTMKAHGKPTADQSHAAAAAAAAASAAHSTAGSFTSAAPSDPSAIWYYTDRYRSQQGPVRPEEILRLYGLLQLNDASLVYCAHTPVAGWTRLSETPAFASQLGPSLIESHGGERQRLAELEAKKTADKKRKREKKAEAAANGDASSSGPAKWKAAQNTTSVYITGLPADVTVEELLPIVKKGGIILEDENGEKRIKIYVDDGGRPKGDAVVKYALPESVDLAITLLDQSVFRAPKTRPPGSTRELTDEEKKTNVITVQKAEFTQKDKTSAAANGGAKNNGPGKNDSLAAPSAGGAAGSGASHPPVKRAKREVGALTALEISKQKLRESLSWDEEPQHSSKLKIVILKPLFTLEEARAYAAADPTGGEAAFYRELKDEISLEIESTIGGGPAAAALRGGRGAIEKLTIFAGNPDGPAAVKFRDSAHAARCVKEMNGRSFSGRPLAAFFFDGKTNYVVKPDEKESAQEEERRLKEFGDWIEGGDDNEMEG